MALEMNMRLVQRQMLVQKLAPQIIQSIEILQLPILDLKDRVEQELSENPVLEVEETSAAQEDVEAQEQASAETETPGEDFMEDLERWRSSQIDVPRRRPSSDEADRKFEAMQNLPAKSVTLQEFLLTQLHLSEVPEDLRGPAELIICNLDDSGYVRGTLEEIAGSSEESDATSEKMERALAVVQGLEPCGVGARDLTECLLLQLPEDAEHVELVRILVTNHLEDIANNRYPKIVRETGRSLEEIKRAVSYLSNFNPSPGSLLAGDIQHYVVPEVIIEEVDGRYEIRLENYDLPSIYVSPMYERMLSNRQNSRETKDFLRKKIQSARWLIESIEQRRNTLQRVVTQIVDVQKGFLDKGTMHLRPLKMQDIADRVGVHVATVCRAIAGKYAQTPQGILPLKFFFTGGTVTAAGVEASWNAVREKISNMIDREDKQKPLSDEEIVRKLKAEGLGVARRTVAKYRKTLGIPSSRKRRQY